MAIKDKQRYFAELAALQNDPDDEYEEDTNDARAVLESSRTFNAPSSAPIRSSAQNLRTPSLLKKLPPSLNRFESAPTPTSSVSVVKETPPVPRTTALRRSVTATTPLPTDASVIKETPLAEALPRPGKERRTVSNPISSTPAMASPFLSSSFGVASMLGKRKRKETVIKMKPEGQQYFKGLTFYYIPPNDIAPARRLRITKAREYGAVWSKELVPEVTHIVADKELSYKDVMTFLKLDALPPKTILVNENYPIDCYGSFKCLLKPDQRTYMVEGYQEAMEPVSVFTPPPAESQTSNTSLQLKPAGTRPGSWDYVPPKQTPPRSEQSTQDRHKRPSLDSVGASLDEQLAPPARATRDPSRAKNELDDIIETQLKVQHLPLDDDEDERPSSRDSKDSDDSDEPASPSPIRKPRKPAKKKTTGGGSFNQENYSCMRGGTGKISETNPNARTIEILQEMCDHYTRNKDQWKSRGYQLAIGVLKRQTTKIFTAEEAIQLPSIGKRIAPKIEEIVTTNRLRKLESAMAEPGDQILQLFLNIYQVGVSQAYKWMAQGYKTLEDLRANASLTPNQKLGIEHYDDLLQRIPREEVTALGDIVMSTSKMIDPEVKVIIGGSYRRGADNSGDIDCLLTKPGTTSSSDLLSFLSKLVSDLRASGFLVAALATPKYDGSKWHGCCVLPSSPKPVWRRIDFLLVPEPELGAALIYWTGDDIFNRSMRHLSSMKGMRLNQRGLYKDVMRGPERVKLTQGSLVEGADEIKIFEALGVPWRPPHERICQ